MTRRFYVDWALMERLKSPNFCVADVENGKRLVAEFVEEADAHEYCAFKNEARK